MGGKLCLVSTNIPLEQRPSRKQAMIDDRSKQASTARFVALTNCFIQRKVGGVVVCCVKQSPGNSGGKSRYKCPAPAAGTGL